MTKHNALLYNAPLPNAPLSNAPLPNAPLPNAPLLYNAYVHIHTNPKTRVKTVVIGIHREDSRNHTSGVKIAKSKSAEKKYTPGVPNQSSAHRLAYTGTYAFLANDDAAEWKDNLITEGIELKDTGTRRSEIYDEYVNKGYTVVGSRDWSNMSNTSNMASLNKMIANRTWTKAWALDKDNYPINYSGKIDSLVAFFKDKLSLTVPQWIAKAAGDKICSLEFKSKADVCIFFLRECKKHGRGCVDD